VRENAFRMNKTESGLRYYTRQNGEQVWVPKSVKNRHRGWQVNDQQFQSLESVYDTIADWSRGLEKMLRRAWLDYLWMCFYLPGVQIRYQ
jgi:hypothetical protein